MPLDAAAIAAGCGGELRSADQLCRRELERFKAALSTDAAITVGCTQEAPLFREVAAEAGAEERVAFANIRENAGWSANALDAGPKMAALLAAAAEPAHAVQFVAMESRGVALVYGRDAAAIEAARRLADHLDITVLLTKPGEIAPPRATAFPVLKGTIAGATGHLGAFSLRIDDFAQPAPSSREHLVFGPARDGATSTCDLVLDLSGNFPLFPAHELRSGYLRADPRDAAAVERLIFEASHLVGTFDKPKFVSFSEALCAHSRSQITGCTRCLELCPTGAITPAGDHVAIDPYVCGGCGSCAAACPTGAVAYEVPDVRRQLRSLRTLLSAYRAAGGGNPVLLFHDAGHGEPLIDALARFGPGLPANVIPVAVNEVTQIGPETIAAAFAYGATGVRLLLRAKAKHDLSGLHRTLALANAALAALGYGAGVAQTVETDDPDALRSALDRAPAGVPAPTPASFLPEGSKRGLLALSFRELHRARAGARRRDRASGRRALRRARLQRRRLHALPCLRQRLPDRGADRQSRAADAALHRIALRPVRVVRRDLPRGRDPRPRPPARYRRLGRPEDGAQGGGALPLRRLRQGLRDEERDRGGGAKARRPALDVLGRRRARRGRGS